MENLRECQNSLSIIRNLKDERAFATLKKDLSAIPTVKKWASEAGVSRGWLYSAMVEFYGETPKLILRNLRFSKIIISIEKDRFATSFSIARQVGLRDDKALYKFLMSNFNMTFTDLRAKIITGKTSTITNTKIPYL